MISIVIDANILFSALYNKDGLERTIINFNLTNNVIQLFAPDIFKEEISRNLVQKLGFNKDRIERYLSEFDVIEVPFESYKGNFLTVKRLSIHQNDIPYIATALFLGALVWSGNENHFKHLEDSTEVIWFNSRKLLDYLKSKGFIR